MKEARHTSRHVILFYIYETLDNANLTYKERNQIIVCLGTGVEEII